MSSKKSNFFIIFSEILDMEGITVPELAAKLGISENTVRQRIHVAGIRPLIKVTIYPPDTLDRIRNVSMGRPPKPKPEDPVVKKPAKPTNK
jgi:predicted ArsR family transcriptional regulator